MAMPVRARVEPRQKAFIVNEDPEVLNQAYNKVLGNGGESMLPEEVKWLAVTHKSFDHGRRGFNDRLAFLGRLMRVHSMFWRGADVMIRKEDSRPAVLACAAERTSSISTTSRRFSSSGAAGTGKSVSALEAANPRQIPFGDGGVKV